MTTLFKYGKQYRNTFLIQILSLKELNKLNILIYKYTNKRVSIREFIKYQDNNKNNENDF